MTPPDLVDALESLVDGLSKDPPVNHWLHRAVRGDVAGAEIHTDLFLGDDGKRLKRLVDVVLDLTDPRAHLERAKGPDAAEQGAARLLLQPTIELVRRRARIIERGEDTE